MKLSALFANPLNPRRQPARSPVGRRPPPQRLHALRDLIRGLKPRAVPRPRPLQQARPDTFTVGADANGGVRCGTPWNTSPTPWNTSPGATTPVSTPPVSTPSSGGAPSGALPNPFDGGKGLHGPVTYGPFFTLGKPDASTTWAQLSQLFAEGRVIGDTGGSCGMTSAQKVEALRSFWEQGVASGKSPAEFGFYVRCGPTPPAGLHV